MRSSRARFCCIVLHCISDSFGAAAAQTVFLVTKEVDMGTYHETLLEMQDVVQVVWVDRDLLALFVPA